MILPMVLVMYLFAKTKRENILWLIIYIITLTGFYAPTSIAAFISVGLVLIILLIMTRKYLKDNYKKLALAILLFFIVASVCETLSCPATGS